ncbi:MAG: 3-deoxy-D-manno-octulosonic acid transferase [Pseudobdellovibrionaceae bacterium]
MVLIDSLVFSIYRFLALPMALGILKFLSPFLSQKLQEMITDRSAQNLQALPARPIWIHASSGEIEYAKSVIRALKEGFPQIPVLVTYFSPSAKKLMQKFPGIDLAMPLPWDRPSDLEKFLNFYNPRTLLIARTDVWPELARIAKSRKIPSMLFAATFAAESSRQGFLASSLTRMALNSLSGIFCVSDEDQENLRKLGVKAPLEVAGDTRFDQVLHRLKNPNPINNALKPASTDRIFICGSTWPEDEDILFDSFAAWISRGGRIVLAPHEVSPERLSHLENQLQARQWTVTRYSKASKWESQILLVDQIGILQELYSWGHLAFVGGSFKGKVHSVMEPLCLGIPVCVGPFHTNNREALQFQFVQIQTGLYAVNVTQNANDLMQVMEKTWTLPKAQPAILQRVQRASGATEKLISWVENSLEVSEI